MNARSIAVARVLLASLTVAFWCGSVRADDKPKQKPGYLGVQIAMATEKDGIVVTAVINNSPAEKAGIKGGDQIVSIDGTRPATLQAAVNVIRSLTPGKKVKFLIKRDGKEKTIEAVPGTLG